jgi:hypothetical protein
VREGPKIRKRTLANLSAWPASQVELLRRVLRGETLVPPEEAFQIIRTRPHGHVAAVLGTLRRVGLDRLIAAQRSRPRDLVVAMVVARLLDPTSKLATARGLGPETLSTTLGEILDIQSADEDDLYEAMDWLLARQAQIEAKLAQRHLREGTLVLYDVTSTYYEGRTCPLVQFGHNRDGKKGKPQIVFGLMCAPDGCPVAVEVFEGNTGDPSTLATQVQKVRERFGLTRIVFVGDRGLLTAARIREELQPLPSVDWITALRAPAIRALVESGALQLSLFDVQDLAEITSPDYPGERLIVCKNPFLAEERARKRQELVEATERALAEVAAATRRPTRPLRGRAQIGLRVGQVFGRFKMAKHFHLYITEEGFHYERNLARIAEEAVLDGLYVIRTSVPIDQLNAEGAVRAYKQLSTVEHAFRTFKGVDLQVRPIHHRLPTRVRAHVFLCMLAYYVEWHMRAALAPMLFAEDDLAAAEHRRASIVAPAQRSPRAQRKAQRKQTEDGLPVHSFQTLLRDLVTIAKNRVAMGAIEFDQITVPTLLQRRAFELLQVSHRL